jgi:two-component system, NtrC family, sensor kinase
MDSSDLKGVGGGVVPLVVWSRGLASGHPGMDDEHRKLIEAINTIAALHDGQEDRERLRQLLDRMMKYALEHFLREEAMMEKVGIDHRHLEPHRILHGEFIRRVATMRDESSDTAVVVDFIARWLMVHIVGIDHSMVRQAELIAAGKSAAEAYDLDRRSAGEEAMYTLFDALGSPQKQESAAQAALRQLLAQVVDGDPVPTLVIDAHHRVTHWNRACALITGVPAADMIGTDRQWSAFYPEKRPIMADLIIDGALQHGFEKHYGGRFKPSQLIDGAFEAEGYFPQFGDGGCWLYFTAAPLRDHDGRIIGAIETLQDITERHRAQKALHEHQLSLEETIATRTAQLAEANHLLTEDVARREQAEAELKKRYAELSELNAKLSAAQDQLMQSEKLASIGQLAAGVAHEINNPIGYVYSNIGSLETYLGDLFRLLDAYEAAEADLPAGPTRAALEALRRELDVAFLKEDVPMLMGESKEGITRVKKIVQDLKDFSHVDSAAEWQWVDLHKGLDSTLNIVNNEIKYRADVVRDYGELPEVECLPMQLNQVFMNLAVNAAHAMGESRGTITVRTGVDGEQVWIEFADNGCGIPEAVLPRIFDPFFTTKPVGKGTGLGLSLSYGIVQNHHGRIEVDSEVGKGTTFRVTLPIRQPQHAKGA